MAPNYRASNDPSWSSTREEAAWRNIRHRIHSRHSQPAISSRSPFFRLSSSNFNLLRSGWVRIAALFILVASLTGIGYRLLYRDNRPARVLGATDQARTDTLFDGSLVTLNRHSLLSIPASFGKEQRIVDLQGEAFFQVRPEKNIPFQVQTNGILITVLGTSFNVHTRNDQTEIVVETGLVEVTWRNNKVLVHPDEGVRLTGDSLLIESSVRDRLYSYYRTREFKCDHTPLWRLAAALDDAYDVHIVIENPSLRELPLTATFHDDSLDHILSVLTETFGIRMVREGNVILLR